MGTAAIPAVERDIAFDLVKRGLLISPIVIALAGVLRGVDGAVSAAIALGIVLLNFLVAALVVSWAATISVTAAGIAAAVGYAVRLVVIVLALWALHDASWIDFPVLGITLVGAHLGLLTWEAKHVTLSLAAPGLKPSNPALSGEE